MAAEGDDVVALPGISVPGAMSVESALNARRSVRSFTRAPLTLAEVAQLLWAAQGVTHSEGFRTAPSAGALYPLEVYLVAGEVRGLAPGIYKYHPLEHRLSFVQVGDARARLAVAALGQAWVADAPAVVVIAAVYRRTSAKYGERAARYVPMEAGHAAQNVYLQATALGLGTTVVGAFHDEQVRAVVQLAPKEQPLALMPLGTPEGRF